MSGEALRKVGSFDNISPEIVLNMARSIKEIHSLGVQVAVVVGGGNIWRGASASTRGMDRTMADYMGMLATIMNGIALQSTLEDIGVETRVQTAIEVKNVAEPYIVRQAVGHLEKGRVVIFVAGTGNPFFHHGHHRCPARQRDQGAGHPQGHEGGRHLHRRPDERPHRHALREYHLYGGAF